ncbi:MAG TPA: aldolase/citrate lyase family protein [Ktedonobacteraceae bacterium]|nr:aldolase/citrate lyase family protein [Ktedonobacteraceae bacterium]
MRTNEVKAKLKRGEPVVGAWLNIPHISTARIMARLGFDWLTVDAEHSAQHPGVVADMVGAIADAGTSAPLVRLPENSVDWVKWSLDAGAWGIIVPMINTRADAEQAVSWAKYPPLGIRSIGGVFGPYGFGVSDSRSYAQQANDQIIVGVQIESAQALENLDAIFTVPGIDVAFVGPNDLHMQLGLPPSSEGAEPEFIAALEKIKQAGQRHHMPLGMFCSSGEAAAHRIREGFLMVSATSDASCLINGASQHLRAATSHKLTE